MVDIKVSFGQRIKELRNEKGMSQEALAFASGLHRTYISDIERGNKNLSLENIEKLSQGLGINIQDFFSNIFVDGRYKNGA